MHDVAHFIAAKIHDVELALPCPIPSIQIGLFGTVTRFLSFPKSRKALFDISIAGPLAGFIASASCILYGISLTQHATPMELASFPGLPTGFFDSSILLYQILDYIPGNVIASSPAAAIEAGGLAAQVDILY